jgi:hypothetical protein
MPAFSGIALTICRDVRLNFRQSPLCTSLRGEPFSCLLLCYLPELAEKYTDIVAPYLGHGEGSSEPASTSVSC